MASVHFDSSAAKIQKVAFDSVAVETRGHKEFSVFLRFCDLGPVLVSALGFHALDLLRFQETPPYIAGCYTIAF